MLTQGPIPDPKCKLNISSFLTLPHLLDCLICTWNSVSIVLFLWMMGRWHREGGPGGWSISGCGWCDRGWVVSHSLFVFLLVLLLFVLSCLVSFFMWVEHDSCCVCFFVHYLFYSCFFFYDLLYPQCTFYKIWVDGVLCWCY